MIQLLIPGLLGILTWFILERALLLDFFTLKTTKQGMNMGALILIVTTFLVLVNFIAVRYNKTWDLSATGQYTLSEQSKKIIDQATGEINVLFFYKNGMDGVDATKKSFSSLVKVYQEYSPKIKLEYVDMDAQPKNTTVRSK